MWRFLRNHRLILCLHTIIRALIYRVHHAVVPAIAWHLVSSGTHKLVDRLDKFWKKYYRKMTKIYVEW